MNMNNSLSKNIFDIVQYMSFISEFYGINQLKMVKLRIETLLLFMNNISSDKRSIYNEDLQQFVDLFAHVYWKKPLKDFKVGRLTTNR